MLLFHSVLVCAQGFHGIDDTRVCIHETGACWSTQSPTCVSSYPERTSGLSTIDETPSTQMKCVVWLHKYGAQNTIYSPRDVHAGGARFLLSVDIRLRSDATVCWNVSGSRWRHHRLLTLALFLPGDDRVIVARSWRSWLKFIK